MSYTKLDLLQDLADMGLTGQETILIHSSMKSIGPVDGGVDTVLDMLNLVDGTRAVLRSKSDAFPPLELHYAETCIVPQAAGDYEISSPDGSEVKVILACVRN